MLNIKLKLLHRNSLLQRDFKVYSNIVGIKNKEFSDILKSIMSHLHY
jgi:hypothetical protein